MEPTGSPRPFAPWHFSSAASVLAATSEWSIDPTHTVIGFSIPHMMVSEVDGKLTEYSANLHFDENDLTRSSVEFEADISSIDTGNPDRDKESEAAYKCFRTKMAGSDSDASNVRDGPQVMSVHAFHHHN